MSELLKTLVTESGLSESDVVAIALTAPRRYKTYDIPKRTGGSREISQPAKEVKLLQRIFAEAFLSQIPLSDAATAYRPGLSIRDNASAHARGNSILKFDFKDFFPSIQSEDWELFCEETGLFDNEFDIRLSSHLLFFQKSKHSILRLAIGAPSSPILSNVLMKKFDDAVSTAVASDHVIYTRYADDLTFSAARAYNLVDVEKCLRRVIKDSRYPKLRLNEEKTVFATSKYRRFVTGLILTDDGTVSLGRERKREIRAGVHQYTCGKLDPMAIEKLAGMLAFVNAVEPAFLQRLRTRYGQEIIIGIRRGVPRSGT